MNISGIDISKEFLNMAYKIISNKDWQDFNVNIRLVSGTFSVTSDYPTKQLYIAIPKEILSEK